MIFCAGVCEVPTRCRCLPLGGAALTLACLAMLEWFAFDFAGIRVSAYAAHALPLCGAALTFFAAAKKVSKESGLTPPVLTTA